MPRPRQIALLPLLLIAAAIGLGACSTTDDDGEDLDQATDEARSTPAPADADQPLTAAEERGRTLFVETCGSCHTLDAAGTQGAIGPNLDELQADRERVLRAIDQGGTGSGSMPPDLYKGQDAQDVAEFVANSSPGV
jgi:mono/diheme cytochrome c family protein